VTAYINLVTQKDIVRNNFRNYTNRVETTRYLAARSVDRVTQSDVDDALSSELGAKISYINSLAAYLTLADSFKIRLGLPLSEQIYVDDQDLKDLMAAGLTPVDISREAAFGICVERHMDILNAIDRFEDLKRKVRIAADQLRTGLTFAGQANVQSEAPYDYANFDVDKIRYTASLTLDLPVDRLRERNTYRSTLVSFESQLRSLASTLDNYKDRIDRGLRSLEEARLNYLNAVASLKVAERRVENNSLRLEAGRSTIRDVREAQDALISAQNTMARSYTAYLGVRLDLLVDIGVIDIAPERFWLMDPLLDQLSPEQRMPSSLRMPDDQVLSPERFIEPAS
jgi:outer membrane protein TolC